MRQVGADEGGAGQTRAVEVRQLGVTAVEVRLGAEDLGEVDVEEVALRAALRAAGEIRAGESTFGAVPVREGDRRRAARLGAAAVVRNRLRLGFSCWLASGRLLAWGRWQCFE